MDLDSSLLRAFAVASEEGHLGRAAERLFISQQAMSKRIARLESTLGARLFSRTPRGMELTTEGARLLPHARDAIDAIDAVGVMVGSHDVVRVDVMDPHSAVVGMLNEALARHPGTRIRTSARAERGSAVELLLAGDVDIAFGRATHAPWPAALSRRPALWEPVGILVGPEHVLADRETVGLRELRDVALRFPLDGAPEEWVAFLAELRDSFGIDIDETGCSLGFDQFVDHPADRPDTATFYGLRMRQPERRGLRVIPIVEPTPVFVWAAMTRVAFPASIVDGLVGTHPGPVPDGAWVPASDRSWLTRT